MTSIKEKAREYAEQADRRECGTWVREYAAYLAGAKAMRDMAAGIAYHGVESSAGNHHSSRTIAQAIRSLLPDTDSET